MRQFCLAVVISCSRGAGASSRSALAGTSSGLRSACDGGVALAQVLFRNKAGMSIGYIPRGPVWPLDDPDAVGELWARIDEVARRRRTLAIIVEPDRPLPGCITSGSASWYRVRSRSNRHGRSRSTSWTTSRSWIKCTRKRATTCAWRCGEG